MVAAQSYPESSVEKMKGSLVLGACSFFSISLKQICHMDLFCFPNCMPQGFFSNSKVVCTYKMEQLE